MSVNLLLTAALDIEEITKEQRPMLNAKRTAEHSLVALPRDVACWSGELHGEVGAMHRAIEDRLLPEKFLLAVVPLPTGYVQELIARVSQAVGWLTLAGATAGLGFFVFRIVI